MEFITLVCIFPTFADLVNLINAYIALSRKRGPFSPPPPKQPPPRVMKLLYTYIKNAYTALSKAYESPRQNSRTARTARRARKSLIELRELYRQICDVYSDLPNASDDEFVRHHLGQTWYC
jgi:hypothetical protein